MQMYAELFNSHSHVPHRILTDLPYVPFHLYTYQKQPATRIKLPQLMENILFPRLISPTSTPFCG